MTNNEEFNPHVSRETTDPVVLEITNKIREVYDPEIPVNIYDLGLIYEINVDMEKAHVDVVMTLTSPFCPAAEELPMWTHEATCSVLPLGIIASIPIVYQAPGKVSQTGRFALMIGKHNLCIKLSTISKSSVICLVAHSSSA